VTAGWLAQSAVAEWPRRFSFGEISEEGKAAQAWRSAWPDGRAGELLCFMRVTGARHGN